MKQSTDIIQNGFHKLYSHLNKEGFLGFDPYDIKGISWVLNLTRLGSRNKLMSLFREMVFELFYTFPVLSRRVFRVTPRINPKAMGLMASSCLDLFACFSDHRYLTMAEECLNWLREHSVQYKTGLGWGYPFHWQSSMYIPAGTPNGIVTTVVGEAFWKHYQYFHDQESLAYCLKISEFLASLPIDQVTSDQICFSYTPLFINHVHNLNLFVAEFLLKTGQVSGNTLWIEFGNKAVNYTLKNQLESGAFDYNGPPEKPLQHYDHYHTGFVLRMLHSIWLITQRNDVFIALEKCYRHYCANFFEDDIIPKLTPEKKYRIDIHSCAESICCLCSLSSTFQPGINQAEKILEWTILNLQHSSGYFYYGILKSRFTGLIFKSKISYIRWGQAWMLRAFSLYFLNARHKKL